MKKIATISVLAVTLAGCIPESKVDEQGRPVAIQKTVDKTCSAAEKNSYHFEFNNLLVTLKYVMFDDHEYVVARSDRGLGIAYSPRCRCKK